MSQRFGAVIVAFALLLAALVSTPARAAQAPMPDSIAAVGDSITQAASSAGSLGADAPQNSWSTGTSTTVNSHYLRLLAAGAPISGRNYNRSVSGAKAVDLAGQMQTVVPLQADYLTVLIGGNDLCTDTVGQMTSVNDFRSQVTAALTTLTTGSPETYVYVVSIPDVYQLWNLFKNNFVARFIWSLAGICQSLLANPTSTQAADVQRRATVRQRNIDFNSALAAACAQFARCLFDGNAAFNTPFASGDVSGDYFHPSVAGQAKLAAVSWAAGYTFAAAPPPNQPPTAGFSASCAALTCSFTDASADDGGAAALTRSWTFGDGAASSAVNPSHTYAAGGTYTIVLSVTDGGGLTDTDTQSVTVSAPSGGTMSVSSLAGSSSSTGKNTWTATVTIAVRDGGGQPVPNATVSTTWSAGAADTCVTAAAGSCTVTSDALNKKRVTSVTLTVASVTHATLTYAPGATTSVTILRPPA
jgi:PKD repeat protein